MRVRVLTLNVLNLEGDPRRQEVLNAELRRLRPDLVSLQEVIQDEGRDQLAQLLEGTGLQGTHQAQTLAYAPPWADRFGGSAVAARWPHRVVETLDLRVDRAGEVHPWCTLATVVELPDIGELLFIATTGAARFPGAVAHERQVVALTELEQRHRRRLPTVLAGDFNARPDSASIRYLTGRQSLAGQSVLFHDAWEVAGDGPGYTWSSDNPLAAELMDRIVGQPGYRVRIDYVFVGSWEAHQEAHARVVAAELVFHEPIHGLWPSDHFGLLVDLELGPSLRQSPPRRAAGRLPGGLPLLDSRTTTCIESGKL